MWLRRLLAQGANSTKEAKLGSRPSGVGKYPARAADSGLATGGELLSVSWEVLGRLLGKKRRELGLGGRDEQRPLEADGGMALGVERPVGMERAGRCVAP